MLSTEMSGDTFGKDGIVDSLPTDVLVSCVIKFSKT